MAQGPCVIAVILLAAALAGQTEAKPAKGRGQHPTPATDPTRLRGAQTAPILSKDPLSGPTGPARPVSPVAPPFPAAPGAAYTRPNAAGFPADPGSECRNTCSVRRSQCIITGGSACDSGWSSCVIDCNLPSPRRQP